jgi:hypothetical protein
MKNSPNAASASSGTNFRTVVTTRSDQKYPRYPTNATAIAALPTHTAIQYPHAVRKPTKSPKARRAYAYGPPVLGKARPSRENTTASSTAPAAVNASNDADAAVLGVHRRNSGPSPARAVVLGRPGLSPL